VAGRNPDFVARHPTVGEVVLEVFEPEQRLPKSVGAFDSIGSIERGFKDRKRKQAQAARGAGLAFMLVIARTNSDIPVDAGALFVRPEFSFPLGHPDAGGAALRVFIGSEGSARLEHERERCCPHLPGQPDAMASPGRPSRSCAVHGVAIVAGQL
jgi:hypothetical protein